MRNPALLSALLLSSLVVACGSDGTSATDAGSTGPLGFTPSNVDLSGFDLSKVGDVIISGANCGIMDTEALSWSCVDQTKYVAKTLTLADQSKLSIFVVRSLRVEASSLIDIQGGHVPVAIVALDTMTFLGSIKVRPRYAGGAFNAQAETKGAGPGGGGGGFGTTKQGGGGGSYCGIGGQGGVEDQSGATPYPKSSAYGTPELVPLLGGSAGGRGSFDQGAGGGAIELVAGKSITLQAGGYISAPGNYGWQGGGASGQEATGAGSGGAILIESPTVKIAGVLATNGGAGGSGAGGAAGPGEASEPGHDMDALPAKAGVGGGNGGSGDSPDGANATSGGSYTAPGGGGGVGRIRINTKSGQADLASSTITPSAKTACFTQGTLKP